MREIRQLLDAGPALLGRPMGTVQWGDEFFYLLTVAHHGRVPEESDRQQVITEGIDSWYRQDIFLKNLYDVAQIQFSGTAGDPRSLFANHADRLVDEVLGRLGPAEGVVPANGLDRPEDAPGDSELLRERTFEEALQGLDPEQADRIRTTVAILRAKGTPTDEQVQLLVDALGQYPELKAHIDISYD